MTDTTYGPKVYLDKGGDEIVVASGGMIRVEAGGGVSGLVTPGSVWYCNSGVSASATGSPGRCLQDDR